MNLNLGLFGFGCVGQGLWDVLHRTNGLRSSIARICVKDRKKSRPLSQDYFTYDKDDILNDPEINVVVELIDDADAAFDIVSKAMRQGKAVVTANKKMVATRFRELLDLQTSTGMPLLYEASTGGSIPIIRNLEEYYDNDLLSGVEGIVNGTTNYIYTQLMENPERGYAHALAEAQAKGFAESNPSLDVDGWDATYKTLIIAAHSMGSVLDPRQIVRRGISHITPFDIAAARSLGCTVKLLSRVLLHGNGFSASVLPALIPNSDSLANINNEMNAIRLHGAFSDDQLLVGKGAGAHPTASAVLSDISALRYWYRYEYKKLQQADAPVFNIGNPVRVFVRGPKELLNELPFSDVHVDHRTSSGSYRIGDLSLLDLSRSFAFNSETCFIATMVA